MHRILDRIDAILNGITMYRVVLYSLLFLVAVAASLGYFHALPFSWSDIVVTAAFLTGLCWLANKVFSETFRAPANVESVYITALILALIITPVKPAQYLSVSGLPFLVWVSIWAMASKYIFAVGKKHVFNPAAFAVALTALTVGQSASWWVGTRVMAPFVIFVGFLIVRKIQRADLVLGFFTVAFATILGAEFMRGVDVLAGLGKIAFETPIVFFATVMLTEPLTTPPTKWLRIAYGALAGILFSPFVHVGALYSTPELALLAGNLFAYVVSPKQKYVLTLRERLRIAPDTYEFSFKPDQAMRFRPGQYLEWTLGHGRPDARGNRRFFTIASSPEEEDVKLGVKFYERSSSFKKALLALEPGDEIVASQCAGDFTLPRGANKKLAFLAGGIGITPFRSMVQHMLAAGEKRSATLVYANKTHDDAVYRDVFDEASRKLGVKTVFTLTDAQSVPPNWQGYRGQIDSFLISKEIPDYKTRIFYVSGPHGFVSGMRDLLERMGVPARRVKTDFFPGFA